MTTATPDDDQLPESEQRTIRAQALQAAATLYAGTTLRRDPVTRHGLQHTVDATYTVVELAHGFAHYIVGAQSAWHDIRPTDGELEILVRCHDESCVWSPQ